MSRRRVIPGFGLSLGFTVTYLSLIILIPLAALFLKAGGAEWTEWSALLGSPQVLGRQLRLAGRQLRRGVAQVAHERGVRLRAARAHAVPRGAARALAEGLLPQHRLVAPHLREEHGALGLAGGPRGPVQAGCDGGP